MNTACELIHSEEGGAGLRMVRRLGFDDFLANGEDDSKSLPIERFPE